MLRRAEARGGEPAGRNGTGVRYDLVEVEVTRPLPRVGVSVGSSGIAVLLRREGKPVGFLMEEVPQGTGLEPRGLADRVARAAALRLLEESLREEIVTAGFSPPAPTVTVALCTKDRPEDAARCLARLLAVRDRADGSPQFEVLVVDNAPSDERTRELVESLPGVAYVREPRAGLDFARNRALAEATGEIVAFLDDDVVVDRGWFDGLLEAWSENPDAAAFTGLVLPYELETEAQVLFERRGGFRRGFEKLRYEGATAPGNALFPCGAGIFGAGCNMAFRRDVFLELGGFDEALDTGPPLPGGGDLDAFYRVIRAGYALVYEPRFLVFHRHRRDRKGLRRQYWTWGLGMMAFAAKSIRTDPALRWRWVRLLAWWFADQGRQLRKSLLGRHVLPPDMVFAELAGGAVGLAGEYGRSRRRVRRIRERRT